MSYHGSDGNDGIRNNKLKIQVGNSKKIYNLGTKGSTKMGC